MSLELLAVQGEMKKRVSLGLTMLYKSFRGKYCDRFTSSWAGPALLPQSPWSLFISHQIQCNMHGSLTLSTQNICLKSKAYQNMTLRSSKLIARITNSMAFLFALFYIKTTHKSELKVNR